MSLFSIGGIGKSQVLLSPQGDKVNVNLRNGRGDLERPPLLLLGVSKPLLKHSMELWKWCLSYSVFSTFSGLGLPTGKGFHRAKIFLKVNPILQPAHVFHPLVEPGLGPGVPGGVGGRGNGDGQEH